MAQPGNFTPILLYGSSTPTNVPLAANLTNSATGSEIAINVADKNLFFKDSGGVVNTVPIRQSSASSNGWLSSTDWSIFNNKAPATSGTSILYGNGSGGFSNVTIGSGISFAGGTLSATGTGGTVTSVAALTLGTTGTDLSSTVANGTTTPVITLNVPTASAANRGALSAADWSTFNGKQTALVSGTNIKTVGGVTLLGSGDIGTIGVAYGGTGLTSLTANYIPYGNGTSAFSSSSLFTYASGNLLLGTTGAQARFTIGVNTANADGLYIVNSNNSGYCTLYANGSSGFGVTDWANSTLLEAVPASGGNLVLGAYSGSIVFQTGGRAQSSRIFASGGVSIGNTTDPGAGKLLVNSGILVGNTTSSQGSTLEATANSLAPAMLARVNANSDESQWAFQAQKKTSTNTTAQVFVRFLINDGATPSGYITANGANAATFTSSSDARLKQNIVDLPNQLSNILALRPVEFDYIDGSGRQIGFIAQEMQTVYADSVSEGTDGMLQIGGWSKTEARLVKAIQEQQAIIEQLKAKVGL